MISLGDVAIMGGGCYGSFYLGQLLEAQAKGAAVIRRILVVDHDANCAAVARLPAANVDLVATDWDAFLDNWLDRDQRDRDALPDSIVPTPLMPHLMASWLERQARAHWPNRDVALVPADVPLGTPYDVLGGNGVRYVSFADWTCPIHCIEPLRCPMIHAPRTWEMGDAVTAWSVARGRQRPTAPPALFTCRHAVYGVGMFPAQAAFEGFDALVPVAGAAAGGDLAIASVSACHGAVALLRVGPMHADD